MNEVGGGVNGGFLGIYLAFFILHTLVYNPLCSSVINFNNNNRTSN